MYKVRFNLGAGKKFMTWKITDPQGNHEYYEPTEVEVTLKGCILKNQVNGAKKIFDGANKFVVAWVEAEEVTVTPITITGTMENKVSYNPRVTPHWMLNGNIVDGAEISEMVSINRGLYLKK